MRKKTWDYRYSVRSERSIVAPNRTDSLKRAITLAKHYRATSVSFGGRHPTHYTVYDHVESRMVFTTRKPEG